MQQPCAWLAVQACLGASRDKLTPLALVSALEHGAEDCAAGIGLLHAFPHAAHEECVAMEHEEGGHRARRAGNPAVQFFCAGQRL